jgi:hypothetical protein
VTNVNLLSGKDIIKAIYTTLFNNYDFINYSYYKTILAVGIMSHDCDIDGKIFVIRSSHKSVLVNNDTPFEEFYKDMCSDLAEHYEDEYSMYVSPEFSVRV